VNWFLLQSQGGYWKEDDPVTGTILLVAIGVIVVGVFVSTLIRNGLGIGKKPSKAVSGSSRRFSVFAMSRIRKMYNLSRDQGRVLEYVLKSNGVIDAERTVATPSLLDRYFKQTYRQIEKSEAPDAQQKLALLFSTRNTIEIYHNTSPGSAAEQHLSAGMDAVLSVNQQSYHVKVVSSQKDGVLVESPRSSIGTRIAFARGAKVKLAFFTKSNKGFFPFSQYRLN
jgi:hypothetical protein